MKDETTKTKHITPYFHMENSMWENQGENHNDNIINEYNVLGTKLRKITGQAKAHNLKEIYNGLGSLRCTIPGKDIDLHKLPKGLTVFW